MITIERMDYLDISKYRGSQEEYSEWAKVEFRKTCDGIFHSLLRASFHEKDIEIKTPPEETGVHKLFNIEFIMEIEKWDVKITGKIMFPSTI